MVLHKLGKPEGEAIHTCDREGVTFGYTSTRGGRTIREAIHQNRTNQLIEGACPSFQHSGAEIQAGHGIKQGPLMHCIKAFDDIQHQTTRPSILRELVVNFVRKETPNCTS